MNDYIPAQRWVSNTEPELGLGLILTADFKRITVAYPACGDTRIYARDNAPLTRVIFSPGDSIELSADERITVSAVREEDGLMTYIGNNASGVELSCPEMELNHHIQFNKPQQRFFTGQFDPSAWFQLRFSTWRHLQRLQQTPARGLLGSRTALIAHQVYIAHEAANRHNPRIMLADEVGLGKTIEAGLILHHRLLSGLTRRVLIMVPETLLHQWLVEMLRRFNLRFSIYDEERCIETHSENPFLAEQLILCGQGFFSAYPTRRQQALDADWDMLVVDEAHHLQWDEQSPSVEFLFMEQLARCSRGLILLTATPEQLGKQSHFARLRLLDPDRFHSYQKYLDEQQAFEPVAQAAKELLAEKPLDEELTATLLRLLAQDHVDLLLQQLNLHETAASARTELLQLLLDHHGTGRILFRNSRHTVHGFPQRELYTCPLTASAPSEPVEKIRIKDAARFVWLVEKTRQLDGYKLLLICQTADMVLELERSLRTEAGIHAAVFHEGMSIIERDRAAAWFADPESKAQLLLCSEIGSEGRNFQFLRHLILFDLPANPDLLQQRIGRLDRIGQKNIIQIHVPYYPGTAEHTLLRWYDEGLQIFKSNSSAASEIYELMQIELGAVLSSNDRDCIENFITRTRQLSMDLTLQLQEGRDQLLELNSCREEVAEQLIAQIYALGQSDRFWPYMEKLLDCYGVEMEYHSPGCHILSPGNHMRNEYFPELPAEGVTVTVDRQTALIREDMQFLNWEHPMVCAAMDMVLNSDTGNAAVSVLQHPQLSAGQFLLEVLYIIECSAPRELQIARFLPPTPIRILVDQQGEDYSAEFSHASFKECEQTHEKEQICAFLAAQKKPIEALIDAAEQRATKTMQYIIAKNSKIMLESLGGEIKRLVCLQKVNQNIKQQEIEQLKVNTQQCFDYIQSARLRLDAVRLIITG